MVSLISETTRNRKESREFGERLEFYVLSKKSISGAMNETEHCHDVFRRPAD